MLNSTKEKIKNAILDYCEGIEWREFNINELDNMVSDIERIVETERSWVSDFKGGERNSLRGDMENEFGDIEFGIRGEM